MSKQSATQTLEQFLEACISCGQCLTACDLLDNLGLPPAEIAQQLLDNDVEPDTLNMIQRCALCGLCSQECPIELDPATMFAAARELLTEQGKVATEEMYDVMLVDRDWHFFTVYRNMYSIQYQDLVRNPYDTLFFPGCTLASYAPEITRKVHQWLVDQGRKVGITDMCCGKPLSSIGLGDRQKQLLANLQQQAEIAGAKQVVTACPNCFHALDGQLGDLEVVSLYDLLVETGVQVGGDKLLTLHDSCPDREGLNEGRQVRNLLKGYKQVEMAHHGANTMCCGSGGIVSMIDPDLCHQRAHERMAEFNDTEADLCVTACMGCSNRLAQATDPDNLVHVLELVFDTPVDNAQIRANVQAMWAGEWGDYNQYCLSQAKITSGFKEDEHE